MSEEKNPMSAKDILDIYFIDNRARLLEIASFLDRIDRTETSREGKSDFRYKAFIMALKIILESEGNRTKAVQLNFSDLSREPLESASGLKAFGAWQEPFREGH
jgi:post-segregation antitoxin (ccd killing protein)